MEPDIHAARAAIQWHKEQTERGEIFRSCRLFDGEDIGPPSRRCWLIPGHQSMCMTEKDARATVDRSNAHDVYAMLRAWRKETRNKKPARKAQKQARKSNRRKK